MNGLADIEDAIIKHEGIDLSEPDVSIVSKEKPVENWEDKPKITRRGGLPSIDMPIEDVKGIGEETAIKLREIGVDTLAKYVSYQEAQKDNKKEDETEDE